MSAAEEVVGDLSDLGVPPKAPPTTEPTDALANTEANTTANTAANANIVSDPNFQPTKRPRGRPKLVKTVSTDSAEPSPRSAEGSPSGEPGKIKPPPKKAEKRTNSNKDLVKKEKERSVVVSSPTAAGSEGGLCQPTPGCPTPTGGTGLEPPQSTGNPLKVRSISTGVFTQTLLGALMTGPPMSVQEISALIPNVTLDQLQGILDTLQLFGVIDKLTLDAKYVEPVSSLPVEPEPPIAASSSAAAAAAKAKPVERVAKIYAMKGFIRGTGNIDIRLTTKDTLKRKAEAVATAERVTKIQKFNEELCDADITDEERREKAMAYFREMVTADPTLVERQIYQYIKNRLPEDASPSLSPQQEVEVTAGELMEVEENATPCQQPSNSVLGPQ